MGGVEKFLIYNKNNHALYALLMKAVPELSQAQIRLILCMNKKRYQAIDLAYHLQMTPQSAGQLIKRSSHLLEALEVDPDDRRGRKYKLSEEGLTVLALLKEALETDEAKAILSGKRR